jgi:hypothetical protein
MLPNGTDITKMLKSKGPIVKCVLLKTGTSTTTTTTTSTANNEDYTKKPAATTKDDESLTPDERTAPKKRIVLADLMEQIEIDTTPQKQGVAQVLGGKFTFVGQYEDEGIVLMARNVEGMDDLPPLNPHVLQPPLDEAQVHGDIVIMKVAATEEELDDDNDDEAKEGETPAKQKDVVVLTNDEFFLDYTKDEMIAFMSRTDVVPPEQPEEESSEEEESEAGDESDDEYEGDEDADEEEERTGIMNLLMRSILRKFTEDNGRGPNTEELLNIRDALAQKMGLTLADIPSQEDPTKKRKLVIMEPTDPASPYKSILRREDEDGEDDDDDGVEEVHPAAKRVKFGEADKEATVLLFNKDEEVHHEEEKKGELTSD